MERSEIAARLERQIKLYRHLGLRLTEIGPQRARFEAKIDDHLNHKGTAFGGSLYAIGVLAGYSVILSYLREAGFDTDDIVIAKGEIDYLRPVDQNFEAVCEFPSPEQERFTKDLHTHAKARVNLEVHLLCAGKLCARLRGKFVVRA